jgi:polyhydroxyalkanoate synthesis regulator phasin
MRFLMIGCVAMLCLAFTPSRSHAQFGGSSDRLDKVLNNFADRLQKIVDDAAAKGDFLIEKNGRILQALVRDARIQFEELLDKKIKDLKEEHQKFLATLDSFITEVKEMPRRLMELEDFLFLDMERFAQMIPGSRALFGAKAEKMSFRRLDGYSLVYQKDGVYTLRFIGAAFGPGFRATVSVNGVKIKFFDMRTPRVYVLECDIPVDVLNKKFVDEKVERVAVDVESFDDKEKPVFSYKDRLLLLPKLPVSIKLTESYTATVWSEKTYDSEVGTEEAEAAGPGVKGEDPHHIVTPSTTIPPGCLMLKDTVKVWATPQDEPKWCRWLRDTMVFSNEDRTVSMQFKHWGGNWKEKACIKVSYRKPEKVTKERDVSVGTAGRVPFGTTSIKLSPEYESFTLVAKWFNGREYTLAPVRRTQPGIKVDLETSATKRLLLDLSWPEFGAKP